MCSTRSGPNLALGFQIHTSKGPGRAPARIPPGLARKCSMYMPCAQLRRLSTGRRAHMADAFIARVEGKYCDHPAHRGTQTAGSLTCCGARGRTGSPLPTRAEEAMLPEAQKSLLVPGAAQSRRQDREKDPWALKKNGEKGVAVRWCCRAQRAQGAPLFTALSAPDAGAGGTL